MDTLSFRKRIDWYSCDPQLIPKTPEPKKAQSQKTTSWGYLVVTSTDFYNHLQSNLSIETRSFWSLSGKVVMIFESLWCIPEVSQWHFGPKRKPACHPPSSHNLMMSFLFLEDHKEKKKKKIQAISMGPHIQGPKLGPYWEKILEEQ